MKIVAIAVNLLTGANCHFLSFTASEKANYELLCLDGTRAPIDSYQTCNLARVPGHAVVSRDDPELARRIFTALTTVRVIRMHTQPFKHVHNNAQSHMRTHTHACTHARAHVHKRTRTDRHGHTDTHKHAPTHCMESETKWRQRPTTS